MSAGWLAFTTSVTVLLTGLGVLLPWLVEFGVPTAAGVWWTRRRRAPHATPAAATATAPLAPGTHSGEPPVT